MCVKTADPSVTLNTPATAKAVLAKLIDYLNDYKENGEPQEVYDIAQYCRNALTMAQQEVLLPRPERRYDVVLTYNWEQFVEWCRVADQLCVMKTHFHLGYTPFKEIYAQFDNSGVPVIAKAMIQARESYSAAPTVKPLYQFVWEDSVLKPIFVAAIVDYIEKL